MNGNYRRLLRWAALPVTDRRWAAPLSAAALGFGLFIGVAVGPGAAGTFGTGVAPIVEIPGFGEEAVNEESGERDRPSTSPGVPAGNGEGASPSPSPATASSFIPASEFESTGSNRDGEASTPEEEPPAPEAASEPEAETLAGVVVHINPAAGSYTVAEPGGALHAIHAPTTPQPGAKVEVSVRPLANGTVAEAAKPINTGTQMKAEVSGTVTYVDATPSASAYAVSGRGVSLLVHIRPDPAGLAPALPVLGAFAKATVEIEKSPPEPSTLPETEIATESPAAATAPAPLPNASPDCPPDPTGVPQPPIEPAAVLWQQRAKADGVPFTYSDFEGIVMAICPDDGKLRVSADDIREGGEDLLFDIPAEIDATRFQPGDSILVTATLNPTGTLSLTGIADDERTSGANDSETAQGDLAEL